MPARALTMRVLGAPTDARAAPSVQPVFGHLTECEVLGAHRFVRHRHEHYEVLLPLSGFYRCRLNDCELTLHPGQAVVVKPGDWHEDPLAPGVRYAGLNFGLRGGRPGVDAALFRPDVPPGLQVADPVDGAQAVFARLHEVVDDGSVAAGGLRSALIAEMFWLLVRALPEAGLARPFRPRDDDREFATRLQRLFDDLGADTLPVAVLARRLGLTANALTHRCRETLGVAPARALRHHRLDRARALIETSDLPVREVALRLGFADPFHFSRAFKRHHGIPPSALR